MPFKLEVSYGKKLGLPRYSSHSHFVTVTVEVESAKQIGPETAKLYKTLQREVDKNLRSVGYLGEDEPKQPVGKVGKGKVVPLLLIGDVPSLEKGKAKLAKAIAPPSGWLCSDTQRAMILNLVDEYDLEKKQVETFAKSLHGVGVRGLNRHQAEEFVQQLIERHESHEECGVTGKQ